MEKRIEADNLLKISIFELKKLGLIKDGISTKHDIQWDERQGMRVVISITDKENMYVRLQYAHAHEDGPISQNYDVRYRLDTTPCRLGGKRFWFLCFMCTGFGKYDGWGRRVGVLYKVGEYFLCRHCAKLTYQSRKLSGFDKKFGKVVNIWHISMPKRCKYKGKLTKRYQKILKQVKKWEDYKKALEEEANKGSEERINEAREKISNLTGKVIEPKEEGK